jgi:protein-disulfide isomerase
MDSNNGPGQGRSSWLVAAAEVTVALAGVWVGKTAIGPATESAITQEQADAILTELSAMRGLLEKIEQQGGAAARGRARPTTPTTAKVAVTGPMLGKADAPVTVVEFTDYQCPYCRRFYQTTYPQLKKKYVDTGQVRWIVRNLPLGFHADAVPAAMAAHCAGDQGKYWEMRDTLFSNSANLGREALDGYGASLGLDAAAFASCLDSGSHKEQIDTDAAEANRVRITGTPTFVIGRTEDDAVNGRRVVGAQSLAVFQSEIDRLLPDTS